jgi:hypothetical protein
MYRRLLFVRPFVGILLALNQSEGLIVAFRSVCIVRSQCRDGIRSVAEGLSMYNVIYFINVVIIQGEITRANEIYVYTHIYVKIMSNDGVIRTLELGTVHVL